ncbi:MAG: deoxyribodipyrimidine photo-lyase [Candidatus Moraniibacteriota bacterium]
MSVKRERIRNINEVPIGEGPVVYWMNREIRTKDNWALLYAQELALEKKVPLIVVYNLVLGFLGGGYRQWSFKIGGLKEVEATLAKKNTSFFLVVDRGEAGDSSKGLLDFFTSVKAGAVVTDFSPIRTQMQWVKEIKKNISCAFQMIDAHNIVPVWAASPKEEWAAYTLRPKLHRLLPKYLEEFPRLRKHPHTFTDVLPDIDWQALLNDPKVDRSVTETAFIPGEAAARQSLGRFLDIRMNSYGTNRNNPPAEAQSDLSPYFHYGMLAPARAALEVVARVGKPVEEVLHAAKNKAKVDDKVDLTPIDHASAFLEELIVRRELADNFCFYNNSYDSVDVFADWAKKTIAKTRTDKREYVYGLKEFEQGKTHDPIWNAAQMEMVKSGKMHDYLRMYWAKKILEWTASPEEAMRVAIALNDKYELDGRDPNGYAGIAWSIGGVHDRAWFFRAVFGTIRYMARSGCEKKLDVVTYIERWTRVV